MVQIQIFDDEIDDFIDMEPGTPVHNNAKIKLMRKLVPQADASILYQTLAVIYTITLAFLLHTFAEMSAVSVGMVYVYVETNNFP